MIIDFEKIIFVILAGGRSKRFGGGFKTFSLIKNKSILDIIIDKLKKNKIEILINVNKNNEKFDRTKLPIIADKKKVFLGHLQVYTHQLISALKITRIRNGYLLFPVTHLFYLKIY